MISMPFFMGCFLGISDSYNGIECVERNTERLETREQLTNYIAGDSVVLEKTDSGKLARASTFWSLKIEGNQTIACEYLPCPDIQSGGHIPSACTSRGSRSPAMKQSWRDQTISNKGKLRLEIVFFTESAMNDKGNVSLNIPAQIYPRDTIHPRNESFL